jgi:hypothetical protein
MAINGVILPHLRPYANPPGLRLRQLRQLHPTGHEPTGYPSIGHEPTGYPSIGHELTGYPSIGHELTIISIGGGRLFDPHNSRTINKVLAGLI